MYNISTFQEFGGLIYEIRKSVVAEKYLERMDQYTLKSNKELLSQQFFHYLNINSNLFESFGLTNLLMFTQTHQPLNWEVTIFEKKIQLNTRPRLLFS